MKLREKRERLLVGLYLASQTKGTSAFYNLKDVADAVRLSRGPGELRTIAQALRDMGHVNAAFTVGGDEGGLNVMITARGIEEAEELLEQHPDYGHEVESDGTVPASDRYVSIADNQRANLATDLQTLRSAVEASNEVGEEDRLIALSEIAAFEVTIIQPRVSSELIERFAKKVVAWLVRVFGKALVGAAATALIAKLLPLVGGG